MWEVFTPPKKIPKTYKHLSTTYRDLLQSFSSLPHTSLQSFTPSHMSLAFKPSSHINCTIRQKCITAGAIVATFLLLLMIHLALTQTLTLTKALASPRTCKLCYSSLLTRSWLPYQAEAVSYTFCRVIRSVY